MGSVPACPEHQTLVDRVWCGDQADDATLERYAAEIPECAECQRALARSLQVHPVVAADRSGAGPPILQGWRVCARVVHLATPAHRTRRIGWGIAAAVAAGIIGVLGWTAQPDPAPAEVVVPAPVAIHPPPGASDRGRSPRSALSPHRGGHRRAGPPNPTPPRRPAPCGSRAAPDREWPPRPSPPTGHRRPSSSCGAGSPRGPPPSGRPSWCCRGADPPIRWGIGSG